eukprot:32802-Chlamydomonas_euryale.AAC.1
MAAHRCRTATLSSRTSTRSTRTSAGQTRAPCPRLPRCATAPHAARRSTPTAGSSFRCGRRASGG